MRTPGSAEDLVRRLRWPLAGFLVVFTYGTVGYSLFGFGLIDALYMTSLALTTAGFNPVATLSPGAKAFTISIAVFGVTVFTGVLAIVTSTLTEGRIRTTARRRRMERSMDRMREHFIVCAYGRVGRAAAREFEAEAVPFVVIDRKEELEEQMRSDGVSYIVGDPTQEAVLRAAGVERARGIVCAVDDDADNVYITVVARSLNPSIFITARASALETPAVLYRAGADRVISPYLSSGRHMALLALRPRLVDYLEVTGRADGHLRLDELLIERGSSLAGRRLADVCGRASPLLLQRGNEAITNPSLETVVQEGDVLLLFGEQHELRPLEH